MVAHQAIRMNLPASLLAGLGQRLAEVLSVHVIEVDVFVAIPTAHHVVHHTGIFYPQLARHESTRSLRGMRLFLKPSGPGRQLPKANPRTMLWVDPFSGKTYHLALRRKNSCGAVMALV